ncbi:MAG TPA: polysaccharide biosynthesis C-terminal domain-containing protein [Candidatus Angelobacter sp.]|jgi:hypothetical protein
MAAPIEPGAIVDLAFVVNSNQQPDEYLRMGETRKIRVQEMTALACRRSFCKLLCPGASGFIQGADRRTYRQSCICWKLPLYVGMIWVLTKHWGIEGAAATWGIRASVDALLLFYFTYVLLPHKPTFLPRLAATIIAGLFVLYVATLPRSFITKGGF